MYISTPGKLEKLALTTVAQLAEHWTSIPKVAGSIPTVVRLAFQGRNFGITVGGVSLFCPTKRAWPKSCPTGISVAN